MNYEEVFKPVLDKDEKIIEAFKPQKFRAIGLRIIKDIIVGALLCAFFSVFVLISGSMEEQDPSELTCTINGVEKVGEECEIGIDLFKIVPLSLMGIIILGVVLGIIMHVVRYHKTFYCCTNKRIIIRTGFIGADFQTLDYDLIGGMDVRVDFLDKICKPNTGTITFASAASPVVQRVASYHFLFVEHPYEVYRRVKEYCSTNKDGKLNS